MKALMFVFFIIAISVFCLLMILGIIKTSEQQDVVVMPEQAITEIVEHDIVEIPLEDLFKQ